MDGNYMAKITIEIDTDKAREHQERVFGALMKVEELYPDSVAVRRLHKALEDMQSALLAKMDGQVTALSGGGKSDPPDGEG